MYKQPITQEAIEEAANEITQEVFSEFRKTFIDNLKKDPLNPDHVYNISKNVADSLLTTLTKHHMDKIRYKYQFDRRPATSPFLPRQDGSELYYKLLIESETRNIEKYQQEVLYPMLQEARLKAHTAIAAGAVRPLTREEKRELERRENEEQEQRWIKEQEAKAEARRDSYLTQPQMQHEAKNARERAIFLEKLRRADQAGMELQAEMARQAEEIIVARARQQQEWAHQAEQERASRQHEQARQEQARQEQERARQEYTRQEQERARQEYARQEQERARQQHERPRPPTGAGNEKSRLVEELSKYGITNRSSYKKWSVKNHPDRFGGQAQEQIDRQTALFKDVQQHLEKLKEIDPENAVFKFSIGRRGMSHKKSC